MKATVALVVRELRIEARGRELFTGGLVMALLILLVGNLAWGGFGRPAELAPGILWVAIVFAGTLTLSRSLNRERDRGTWESLALLPMDWGNIYFAKVAANLAVLLVVEAAALPLYAILFDFDIVTPLLKLLPLLLLGTLGFCAAGTLLAGVSAHGRAREILLPVLLVPVLFPLLMMSLQATQKVLDGLPSSQLVAEHEVLLAFDVIFLAIGWLTFDYVLGE